jgi:hypothetical protein
MARFQVGFASAEPEGLFAAVPDAYPRALNSSWIPGATANRYGRTWFLSRQRNLVDSIWTGRIGFVQEDELMTVFWDPNEADFARQAAPSGVVVPFAIDANSGSVAFQLISGVVRPTTFTGAFQALLNQGPTYRWRVRPFVIRRTYEEWRSQVPILTEFSFRLEAPNPHYVDEPEVERLLEELELQVARLIGRAREGHGINDGAELFRQALDHVRRNYGRGVIKGRDEAGLDTEWDSSNGGTMPVRRRVESAAEGEIEEEDLIRTLSQEEGSIGDLVRGEPEEDDTSR